MPTVLLISALNVAVIGYLIHRKTPHNFIVIIFMNIYEFQVDIKERKVRFAILYYPHQNYRFLHILRCKATGKSAW